MSGEADEILDSSERDERLFPVADLAKAVEFAELLATLDDRALAAVEGLVVEVGPKVLELALALGSVAARSLLERELGKRK